MATAIKAAATSAEPYCLPELLSDIRLLDLLELSGSTVQASQFLSLSQPTVSRRYRSLAQDFDLKRADLAFEFMLNALRLKDGFALALFSERTGLPLSAIESGLRAAQGLTRVAALRSAPLARRWRRWPGSRPRPCPATAASPPPTWRWCTT